MLRFGLHKNGKEYILPPTPLSWGCGVVCACKVQRGGYPPRVRIPCVGWRLYPSPTPPRETNCPIDKKEGKKYEEGLRGGVGGEGRSTTTKER